MSEDVVLGVAEGAHLNFRQLKVLCDKLNSLMGALTFNVETLLLPIVYSPRLHRPAGSDTKTDIERLLDFVADSSQVLHAPEKRPQLWEHQRGKLTAKEVAQVNFYRRKFGLPEA